MTFLACEFRELGSSLTPKLYYEAHSTYCLVNDLNGLGKF